ncbi:chemotaxis protein CheW [Blastopirellula marina]|uniref:Modulation of CheA activity in response to attractants (Chemotaxis protein) n=1 Tax=Blastopirellula marina DSM 3645 TaxID=314230 RepID=A3ZLL7_9BACT|nr:chemotaxis protein CheW [Blastopirellula marina]EAQ82650.1 modulation of CheA activity in response to attractants (chemotaxis protein) [Blastopirellula marina DSM 3645]
MPSVSNILLQKDILLESGTNELEILVFSVGRFTFGINVAKVREVLPRQTMTALPQAHPSVLGVFQLRNNVVPCVSLRKHLQIESDPGSDQQMILTDFNRMQTAFTVDAVARIHRISWEKILAVPAVMATGSTPVTAVAQIDGKLVSMLDFEMIADQITEKTLREDAVSNPHQLPREQLRIVVADDSVTVRQAMIAMLSGSGYTQVQPFENGRLCWEWLEAQWKAKQNLAEIADLLISDVEMPQIDGFHLTKRVKEHPGLGQLPVLLYSSIVTPDNAKKGEAVGADAQISKPELHRVVAIADDLILRRSGNSPNAASAAKTVKAPPAPEAPVTQSPHQPTASEMQDSSIAAGSLLETFRVELGERIDELRDWLACNSTDHRALLRTLHSIKSAAQVVPVHDVSHAVHQMEEVVLSSKQDTAAIIGPLSELADWLQDLSQDRQLFANLLPSAL